MKIFIRGGVWSNVEDQVLIASYMKYGNNQWTRIASLLPRKSASQVKARWEEYLDPTIRKTPWTHSEDEKLLHFARFMPMQWRTIAQFFGRSSYQCVERYRELMAKATGTTHIDDNESASTHQMMPFFETMKSTPDSVELDQDEREMLEEARARLANTQGKKARRKARTRQLDVLRKTARMRKKKELDAAGLIIDEKKMWEQEENELDPIRTHQPVKGPFDTSKDDKEIEKNRIFRIKQKQKQVKEKEETLDILQNELKKEEKKLKAPVDHFRKEMIFSEQTISDNELRMIEKQRHHDEDYLFQRSELSLFDRKKADDFFSEPQIEEKKTEYMTPPYQKSLPRPIPLGLKYLKKQEPVVDPETLADQLIRQETFRLAFLDARAHPDTKRPPPSLVSPTCNQVELQFANVADVNEDALLEADIRIKEALEESEDLLACDEEKFKEAWNELHSTKEDDDLSEPLSHLRKKVAQEKEKSGRAASKGIASSNALYHELNTKLIENHDLLIKKELFANVYENESVALTERINMHKEKIAELESKQRSLDTKYEILLQQKKEQMKQAKRNRK